MNKEKALRWSLWPLKIVWKTAIVALMLLYTYMGTISTIALIRKHEVLSQSLDALPALAEAAIKKGNPRKAAEWVSARPLSETAQIMKMMEPLTAKLDYAMFFEYSRRLTKLQQPEEALFWLQYGAFRLGYDLMRCNIGEKRAPLYEAVLKARQAPEIKFFTTEHPKALDNALKRVLALDDKYPAANDPGSFCSQLQKDATWDRDLAGNSHMALRKIAQSQMMHRTPALPGKTDAAQKPAVKKPAPQKPEKK